MEGLTDKQQAVLSMASAIMVSVGAISIPAGVPIWVGTILSVIGAIGFGIKEALGGKKPEPQPQPT